LHAKHKTVRNFGFKVWVSALADEGRASLAGSVAMESVNPRNRQAADKMALLIPGAKEERISKSPIGVHGKA
jgi:hypothetical protein